MVEVEDEDDDVKAERLRVEPYSETRDEVVTARRLRKVYNAS